MNYLKRQQNLALICITLLKNIYSRRKMQQASAVTFPPFITYHTNDGIRNEHQINNS